MDIIFYWCFLTLFFVCSHKYMNFKGNDTLLALGTYIGLIGSWCGILLISNFNNDILSTLTYTLLACVQYQWITKP